MISLLEIISKYKYQNEFGYVIYPRIDELYRMLDEIIVSENIYIEKYLYILPFFYFRGDEWKQFEYDEGCFYVAYGNSMSESEYQQRIIPIEPTTPLNTPLSNEERKILNPNNIQIQDEFIKAIREYKKYLPTLLKKMYENSITIGGIDTDEKKATGYFKFEIHCE